MKIILVRPKDSINIGSVARVMQNFGFLELILIAPDDFDQSVAKKSACWATKILEDVKIFGSIHEAVKDLTIVVGFSSRTGKNLPRTSMLNEWIVTTDWKSVDHTKMALMFGPEDTGLTNEDLGLVTDLVSIPTAHSNPSMNLSHAVAVTLYCVSQLTLTNLQLIEEKKSPINEDLLAPLDNINALEQLIFAVCKQNGFFNENTPTEIPQLVGNIFRRSKLSKREVSVLQGIFGRSLS